ncbi:MAG: Gfo/Idh/MocA family oxidoreductase, partial [Alphaproteobacteria bacterium]|nr:Gfo/Idh/MocA family oxidoreductase [Alphaproteobacteria bacterium]
MKRLRTGVIGAGLIGQVEHIPNLVHLRERFELAGVCDPSVGARGFIAARYGVKTVATPEELLALGLDAVAIASPDALHTEHVLAALDRGLHVFCEKPLCYDPADAERIRTARDRAKRVVQVGYMKRFDASYEALL